MVDEIVRTVPLRSSTLRHLDPKTPRRPRGRTFRALAREQRQAAESGALSTQDPTVAAPPAESPIAAAPDTGTIALGNVGEVLTIVTALLAAGHPGDAPVVVRYEDGQAVEIGVAR